MLNSQLEIIASPYLHLYDMLVPKDNKFRRLNELVDFSFVYHALVGKYCIDNGRPAEDPVRMFKYLIIKMISNLSDVDLVDHCRYDLSYKYFLGLAPEETDLINPSTLTKFRRLRLKDVELMDLLIGKTISIARSNGIRLSGTIIVDSTHTEACYTMHKPIEVLRMRIKNLLHSMEEINGELLAGMPVEENVENDLQVEMDFCTKLIEFVSGREYLTMIPKISERLNMLREGIDDLNAGEELALDREARVGHKSPTHTFNGYKDHIAADKDTRLITAAITTTGQVADGPQLEELIERSEAAGVEVNGVIGDTAYSSTDNLDVCKQKEIPLYSKLHPIISNGTHDESDGFYLNKDAGLMVCPQGHMALRKAKVKNQRRVNGKTYTNQRHVFYFDTERCRTCPLRDGCYSGGKAKTKSVSIEKDAHKEQREFQNTEGFRQMYRERYQIEAINATLKNCYGYGKAESFGLQRMQLQSAVSIFVYNLERILRMVK